MESSERVSGHWRLYFRFRVLVSGNEFLCACARASVGMYSENSLWKPIVSFYHRGLGDQTQVIMLGIKCLYLLNHLTGLFFPSTSIIFSLFSL